MKTLKKMLLINWHYIAFETLNFSDINFLTGKNASGKTTIIDALQLVILGDTTGHFFNKSATDKSSRNLKGYLRCEIGDNDDGSTLYLRNGRFSSYIVLEFEDAENGNFVVGIAFDSYEDGSFDHKYFAYAGTIPENKFVQMKVPMDIKTLRQYLFTNYTDVNFFETNQSYRDYIKIKFGNLGNNFFSLFKKAIPFAPITNIESFITEYICDVKNTIDVAKMQENIRSYKKLEIEAEALTKRVDLLKNICDKYTNYITSKESVMTKQYLMQRSDLYISSRKVESLKTQIVDLNNEIEDKTNLLANCEELIKQTNKERDNLIEEKFASDIFKRKAQYIEEEKKLTKEIALLQGKVESIKENLNEYLVDWIYAIEQVNNTLGETFTSSNIGKLGIKLLDSIRNLDVENNWQNIDYPTLENVQKEMSNFKNGLDKYVYQLVDEEDDTQAQITTVKQDIKNLSSGHKSYDPHLLQFKTVISNSLQEKFGKKIAVDFLADLLDMKDESWRAATETYLNTQRFYLIVDPKYVGEAIKIYNDVKGVYHFYDFGIIDTEKVVNNAPEALKDALSNEVVCKNEASQAYINLLLGNLIKCENINTLRNHPRSITKDGMLYQNYVARSLNIAKTTPFIGSGSHEVQLANKQQELNTLQAKLVKISEILDATNKLSRYEVISTNEIKMTCDTFHQTANLPNLEKELVNIQNTIKLMSDNYLDNIERKIKEVEIKIAEFNDEKTNLSRDIITAQGAVKRISNEDLPLYETKAATQKNEINKYYDKKWITSVGEPAFIDVLKETRNLDELSKRYKLDIDHTLSTLNSLWKQIIEARVRYNTIYQTNNDPNVADNEYYDSEYQDLGEVKLKEYREKITIAKDNAMKEFRNDFLAKLKSNFDSVISQIESLNGALEHAKFGGDSYHFTVQPRSEYKAYYNMINDPLLLTGEDISNTLFMDQHGDTIEDLFRQITFVDEDLGKDLRAELERNIAKYTDYRSYLKFDLIVTNAIGHKLHLSKALLKRSGGETQTPFYISILASFSQTYRMELQGKNSSIRLIIFDEAFSKMDSERIQESIRLLRSFNLQAIISAPPEKLADISPLVDKTLCVVRDNTIASVKDFQKVK